MVRSTDAPACAELLADKWNKISNELWADGKNSDELGWCYCSCIKPITWVWWYLPKSQHSVSGQEELGIQGLSYLRSTSEQNQELCCNGTRKSALVGGLFLWK